jgi:hypothetical protein
VRALEYAQPSARGRWYLVVDGGIVVNQFAVEASMEFAGTGEVSALALKPGAQASSRVQQVLAPAMEYLFQMLRVVEGRRGPRPRQMNLDTSYLLVNREAFEVVHRINRMPGILNEAGWNIWSYQLEGLRTFDADGSRWLWREIGFRSWPNYADLDNRVTRHAGVLIAGAVLASLIPVAGLVYGILVPLETAWEATILAPSAVSYALMTISYFLYARKLNASASFAPLWFLVQPVAALLTFLGVRKAQAARDARDEHGPHSNGRPRRGRSRETFR